MNSRQLTQASRLAQRLILTGVLLASICSPAFFTLTAIAQPTLPQSAEIPPGIAIGDAIAAVGTAKVYQDQSWADYEDVVILAAANEAELLSLNAGKPLSTKQLTTFTTEAKSWLDKNQPSTASLLSQDRAGQLVLAVDWLCQDATALSSQSGYFLNALTFLDRNKSRLLEQSVIHGGTIETSFFGSATFTRTSNSNSMVLAALKQAVNLGLNSPLFASVANTYLSDLTGLDTNHTYAQAKLKYPYILPTLGPPNADGSYTLELSENGTAATDLMVIYKGHVKKAHQIVDTDLAEIEKITGKEHSESAPALRLRAFRRQRATSVPMDDGVDQCSPIVSPQACLAQLSGAIFGDSSFAGSIDSGIGDALGTVGEALTGASSGIDDIASDLIGGVIGAIDPVGDLVSAGMQILGLFGGGSDDTQEFSQVFQQLGEIQQEIAKTSEQIQVLQTTMTNDFELVDAGIDTLLSNLRSDFNLLASDIDKVIAKEQSLELGLFQIQSKLTELEQLTVAYDQYLDSTGYLGGLNGCIDYREHFAGYMSYPYYSQTCQLDSYNWIDISSPGPIWAPNPPASEYSDDEIYDFFEALSNSQIAGCGPPAGCPSPFSVAVNYLANFPVYNLNDESALASTPLPNPDQFGLAARAYLEVAHQWPQYESERGSNGTPLVNWLDNIKGFDQGLLGMIENANSMRAGKTLKGNTTLFSAIAGKYTSAVSQLNTAIQGIVTKYDWSQSPGIANLLSYGGNLWGGPAQATNYTPPGMDPGVILGLCGDLSESSGYYPPSDITQKAPIGAVAELLLGQGQTQASACEVVVIGQDIGTMEYPGGASVTIAYQPVDVQVNVMYQNGPYLQEYNVYDRSILLYLEQIGDVSYLTFFVPKSSGNSSCVPILEWGPEETSPRYKEFVTSAYTQSLAASGYVACESTLTGASQTYINQYEIDQLRASGSDSSYVPQREAPLVTMLDTILEAAQAAVYSSVATSIAPSSAVENAAELLTGTKLLNQAFASYGLAESSANDDRLHGMLYGSQAIEDGIAVENDLNMIASKKITGAKNNRLDDEINTLKARATNLENYYTADLANVEKNQNSESIENLNIVKEDLTSLESLVNGSTLSPCDYSISSPTIPSKVFTSAGGKGSFVVQTGITQAESEEYGCGWSATSGSTWVSITSGKGNYNGTVKFSVPENTSTSPRAAVIAVGDQVFEILQAGAAK